MEILDIDADTEGAFFTCLGRKRGELPPTPSARKAWYERYKDKGYRARVLVRDDGTIVGKVHAIPIEHSPFVGQDLLAILCIYVHMYEQGIGDQRRQGYGRVLLEHIEQDARDSGFKGVVGWAMDWTWNPIGFYLRLGYEPVDREDKLVVVWKPFASDAVPPRLLRLKDIPGIGQTKVNVLVADNPWCLNNSKLAVAREAIRGLEHVVEYCEAGPPYRDRIIHLGHVGGVYLDGVPYRPYQLIGEPQGLRAEILRLYESKRA